MPFLRGLRASVLPFLCLVLSLALVGSLSTRISANEPYARFLRALEENGLSDVALEYIDRVEKLSDLPPEVRETLDLERSNCLRAAARDAYDARQAEQLLADSQKYLDKFLAGHPNHPAAATSILMWGDSLFELGQRSAVVGRRTSDAAQKTKLLGEARQYFKQAESRYGEAQERFRARYAQLSPEKSEPPQRPPEASDELKQAESGAVQARFKLGLVKYQLAQTYEDAKSPERVELLKAAAKCFNDIFQQYRGPGNADDERCIAAQLWQGKALGELGDEQTAIEVFDELLVRDTSPSETALAPFYAQATFFKYGIWRKQGKIDELIDDGGKWVEARKSWAKEPYFNGVVLEVARAYQTQAENLTGGGQQEALRKAATLLADAAKVESPFKSDIVLLRRDVLDKLGGKNIGAADFLALGDIALREENLADATKNFELARQKALEAKDEKAAAEAKSALDRVALRQAQILLEKKQYEESLSAAEALAQGDAADPTTIAAAELALRAAYFLGADAADKKNAFARLEKVADFVKNKWPGRPVADVARMILAQSLLQKGDTAGALQMFAQVKPESSRYPWALYNIGRIEWITYLAEKRKENDRNDKLMADASQKARDALQKCVDSLQKSLGPGKNLTGANDDPAEAAQALQLDSDAKLLQSEICFDGKEYRKAVELLDPLVAKIKADPTNSNESATTVFIAAIRARLGAGEAEKAADDALALLARTDDEPRANAKLVSISRLLAQELKVADAAVTDAQGDAQKLEAATARRDAIKQRLRQLFEPLGKRAKHALADLVFLGDACFNLDLVDEGGQIYQSLLDRAKEDPAFAKKSEKVLVFARAKLVDVLRSQGKLEEALKQADELVEKNSNALSPKMTRAGILEDLAKQDPKKLEAAITQWSEIRVLLSHDNPKRPEYFDVIYKIARGLFQQSEKSKDKSKLVPAEQLLKTTLIQYATLGSQPDLVAKYNDLLKKIADAKTKK